MQNALHIYRLHELDGFDVSTGIFTTHLELRIFPTIDEQIPVELINLVREEIQAGPGSANLSYTQDAVYDVDAEDYSTTEFHGFSIVMDSFETAREVHDLTVRAVNNFLSLYSRKVSYTLNS